MPRALRPRPAASGTRRPGSAAGRTGFVERRKCGLASRATLAQDGATVGPVPPRRPSGGVPVKRPNEPGLDTRTVHGPHLGATGAMSTPIVHSATFSFDSLDDLNAAQAAGSAGAFYQRNGHPTINAVEDRLAALDGAEGALLFPSGMGAIGATFLATLKSGDH